MKYSVCVPAVLGGRDPEQAVQAVKNAGFNSFELWSWWDQDVDAYCRLLQTEEIQNVAICTRFISLTDANCRPAYLEGLRETVAVCRRMGCKTIISQVGQESKYISREVQHESIVDGLKACVPLLREHGITLVIEPLNTRIDHPGYYLWSSEEAFRIIDEVDSPYVKVLYDLYHQYAMNDLKIEQIISNITKIGHFHMAGYPGRHEPLVDSEINYPEILTAIWGSGYEGYVGLEYFPVRNAENGLKSLSAVLAGL